MPKNYTLLYHEMTFLKIKHKDNLNVSKKYSIQTIQTCIKCGSINLYANLNKITENTKHALLECARGVE